MSDPYTTLKKFLVLRFMEDSTLKKNTQVQDELIQNAIKTAEAVERISMFGNKDKQNWPNPQMPKLEYQPTYQPQPQSQQQQDPKIDNTATGYNPPDFQKAQKIQEITKIIMELNNQLMQMQMNFFQNVQNMQAQLNEISRSLY